MVLAWRPQSRESERTPNGRKRLDLTRAGMVHAHWGFWQEGTRDGPENLARVGSDGEEAI